MADEGFKRKLTDIFSPDVVTCNRLAFAKTKAMILFLRICLFLKIFIEGH